jgi:hypothetical protein
LSCHTWKSCTINSPPCHPLQSSNNLSQSYHSTHHQEASTQISGHCTWPPSKIRRPETFVVPVSHCAVLPTHPTTQQTLTLHHISRLAHIVHSVLLFFLNANFSNPTRIRLANFILLPAAEIITFLYSTTLIPILFTLLPFPTN